MNNACLIVVVILATAVVVAAGLLIWLGFYVVGNIGKPTPDAEYLTIRHHWEFNLQHQPQWTPDGGQIIFFSQLDRHIYSIQADGSRLRRLFQEEKEYFHNWHPAMSPDGSLLAYSTMRHPVVNLLQGAGRNFDIETSSLDGTNRRRLTFSDGQDVSPFWSPDGTRIAFERRHSMDTPPGIYTVAPNGTSEFLVLSLAKSWEYDGFLYQGLVSGPVWQPHGDLIAFVAAKRTRNSDSRNHLNQHVLYTVNADGSNLSPIFTTRAENHEDIRDIRGFPRWSPDGRLIAFMVGGSSRVLEELRLVSPDGSYMRRITYLDTPYTDGFPAPLAHPSTLWPDMDWSLDGRTLYLAVDDEVIFLIDLDGLESRVIPTPARHASFSPDGTTIAVARYPWTSPGEIEEIQLLTVDLLTGARQPLVISDPEGNLSAAKDQQ